MLPHIKIVSSWRSDGNVADIVVDAVLGKQVNMASMSIFLVFIMYLLEPVFSCLLDFIY